MDDHHGLDEGKHAQTEESRSREGTRGMVSISPYHDMYQLPCIDNFFRVVSCQNNSFFLLPVRNWVLTVMAALSQEF